MYIVLISVFTGLAVYFFIDLFCTNIVSIGHEGKVQNAIENKNKNKKDILMPVINKRADALGKIFSKIRNRKFQEYVENISKDLKNADGNYKNTNANQFVALQLFAGIFGGLFCFFIISSSIIVILFFVVLASLLPLLKLKEDIKSKKNKIIKQLPDMADLISVMLDAGADFFVALNKVCDILQGPLSDELKSASSKISLGYDKKTALIEVVEKTGVEQLNFFVKTINMALDAGVGMADTLKRLAVQLRNERANNAEKKAQEAPVKMLIPMVLFIFPTVFIMIFGPIAINLIMTGGF